MKGAAEHITEVLSLSNIYTEVGDKTFWELAEEGTKVPFVNFSITDQGPVSRDGIRQYNTAIRIYAANLTEGSRIGEVIRTAIDLSSYNWKDRGGRSSYSDTDGQEAFIELTFDFKH